MTRDEIDEANNAAGRLFGECLVFDLPAAAAQGDANVFARFLDLGRTGRARSKLDLRAHFRKSAVAGKLFP
jgi:hypothetical protein